MRLAAILIAVMITGTAWGQNQPQFHGLEGLAQQLRQNQVPVKHYSPEEEALLRGILQSQRNTESNSLIGLGASNGLSYDEIQRLQNLQSWRNYLDDTSRDYRRR